MTIKNLTGYISRKLTLIFLLHIVGNKAKRRISKPRISKRVFQYNKHTRTYAYQGIRNVHFSTNLVCLIFLKHPF